MATKKQVLALAEKQGADVEVEMEDGKLFCVTVILPEGFIWDNGYNSGSVSQEKYEGESLASFWRELFDYIDAPIVKEVAR
jgi:hypothetical protein